MFDYFNFHECSAHLGILAKFHLILSELINS